MDALIGWIGGKRLLRKVIAPYVPKDITGFIEPFLSLIHISEPTRPY